MASITTLRRGGKIIGFQTENGKDQNGKPIRKFHKTYDEAQAFNKSSTADQIGSAEFYGARHIHIADMSRAAELGVSIRGALEFFAKHGPKAGNPLFSEVVAEFIKNKKGIYTANDIFGF